MGKIGDLIVRLQLKYQDYEKGLKKAEKDTKGFGTTLGKIKVAGMAVWAAVGASAITFAKQLIKSSQRIGDAWNRMTSQIKGGWDVFVQSVGSWNWENFIGRIKEATVAARELTNALDSEFEVSNSIKLQKAAMAEELAELEVLARDQTKSYEERAAAAEKYLAKVKPLYDQELKLAQRLEDAHLGKFIAGSGLKDTEQVRQDLRKFLVDIGKYPELLDKLAAKSKAEKVIEKGVNVWGSNYKKVNAAYDVRNQLYNELKNIQSGYQTDLVALFRAYNDMRGDEDAKPLVDAMIRAGEAAGAFNRETKRMQSALNTSLNQINKNDQNSNQESTLKEQVAEITRMTEKLAALPGITSSAVQMNLPDIIPDDWLERNREKIDAALEEAMRLQEITNEINRQFNEAVVNSLSGATQALVNCITDIEGADASQVLAALLRPFGQTMVSLGEILLAEGTAIEVFQKSLKTLEGAPAIAAGLSLIALGTALTSSIQSLAGSSYSSASSGGDYSASAGIEKYEQEITVKVVGEISGDKIILAGQKTLNKWNR